MSCFIFRAQQTLSMIISSLFFLSLGLINLVNAAPSSPGLTFGTAVSPSGVRSASTNSTIAASTSRASVVSSSPTNPASETDLPWSYTGPKSYVPASGQPFQVITKLSTNTFTRTPQYNTFEEVVTGVDGELQTFSGKQTRIGLVFWTLVSAVQENPTSTSYHPWDLRQFDKFFDPLSIGSPLASTVPPSIRSSWSSFTNYGRQQACTDDFSKLVETQPHLTYTSLECIPYEDPNATPIAQCSYGYIKEVQTNSKLDHCCGKCEFIYESVQLFYWPAEHRNDACYATAGNATRSTSVPGPTSLQGRAEAPTITPAPAGIVTAVGEDGFIYTSPYLYVRFPRLLAVDDCGYIGMTESSSTHLSFTPGELSTLIDWCPGHGCTTSYRPFNPADMPCGPSYFTGGGYGPVGEPGNYLPHFMPFTKLKYERPEWEHQNCEAMLGWNGFDPPKTLEPATAMRPSVTNADPGNGQKPTAAPSPAAPPLPVDTGASVDPVMPNFNNPQNADLAPEVAKTDPNTQPQTDPGQGSPPFPNNGNPSPPQESTNINPKTPQPAPEPANQVPGDAPQPPANNGQSPQKNGNPSSPQGPANPDTKSSSPTPGDGGSMPNIANPIPGASPQAGDTGQGSTPYASPDSPGNGPPQAAPVNNQDAPQPAPIVFGGFTFSAIPSAVGNDPNMGQVPAPINGPIPTNGAAPNNEPGAANPPVANNRPSSNMASAANNLPAANNAPATNNPPAGNGVPAPNNVAPPKNEPGAAYVPVANDRPSSTMAPATDNLPAAENAPAVNGAPTTNNAPAANGVPAANNVPAANAAHSGNNGVAPNNVPASNNEPVIVGVPNTNGPSGSKNEPASNVASIPNNAPATNNGPASNNGPSIAGPAGGPSPNVSPAAPAYAPQPSGLMVGGTTILPGGPAISISGTPISIASSHIVIGTSTIPLPSTPPSVPGPIKAASPPSPATFAFAGHTYTANPTGFTIGGETLLPGAPAISISGTPISLASTAVIVGTSTIPLPTPAATPSPASYITLANNDILTVGASNIVVAGATLTPGAPGITAANGVPMSLGSSVLVVGTRTQSFSAPIGASNPVSTGAGTDVGALIMEGFGAETVAGSSSALPSEARGNAISSSLSAAASGISTEASTQTPPVPTSLIASASARAGATWLLLLPGVVLGIASTILIAF